MNISLYARLLRFSIAFGLIALSGCNSNDPQSPVIGNNAPSISDLNEGNQIQAEEGATVSFPIAATDLDNDALSFTWDKINLPPSARFVDDGAGTGNFDWVTNFDDAGVYSPTFIVSDGELSSEVTVTIAISNVNQAPVWISPDPNQAITGNEDEEIRIEVSAEDPDGDVISIIMSDAGGLPEYAEFNDHSNGTADINWTPGLDDAGSYSPTFTVSDGELTTELTVTITISNTNQSPIWVNPDPNQAITGNEDEEIWFEVIATDPDNDDLSIILADTAGLPVDIQFTDISNGTGVFRWTPGFEDGGRYTPTFVVSDGEAEVAVTLEIAVGDVNVAPVWESPNPEEPVIGFEGGFFSFRTIVSDPDSDPVSITLSDRGGLPDNAEFSDNMDNTGTFNWELNYNDGGEYNTIFTISDGEAERTIFLTITIMNTNRSPELEDVNEGNSFEVVGGDSVEFRLSATDEDGDALVFSVNRVNLPESAVFVDNGDGSANFSWDTMFEDVGTYEPMFVVSDGDLTAFITVTLTVTLPPFSFFVTSLASMQELSGSHDGFGGDLRYGEDGDGAGLRGADKICMEIAEMSMPGSAAKEWRAFLSVHDDGDGIPLNAIDRIGDGPWYDRLGRLVAPNKQALVGGIRPQEGDPTIRGDLPNEWGVPNHRPDPNEPPQPNHHTLTGSFDDGTLYPSSCADGENSGFRICFERCIASGGSVEQCLEACADDCFVPISSTCSDWTTADGDNGEPILLQLSRNIFTTFGSSGRPRIGLSWERAEDTQSWVNHFYEVGCAPGGNVTPSRGNPNIPTVGFGGGYGGIYCFGLNP